MPGLEKERLKSSLFEDAFNNSTKGEDQMSNFFNRGFCLTCYVTLFLGLFGFGFNSGVCCNGELDFDETGSSGEAAWPGDC